MRSRTSQEVRDRLAALPESVQRQARNAYKLFKTNPAHPSLGFKLIDPADPRIYSVRVGMHYRAVGIRQGDRIVWYWIGSHAQYDKL